MNLKFCLNNFLKNKVIITTLFGTLSFFILFLLFIRCELNTTKDYLSQRFENKITESEVILNNYIEDAKHLMYVLGVTIADESMVSDKTKLEELIHNFDPRLNYSKKASVSLSGIIFVNKDKTEIIQTIASNSYKKIKKENAPDINLCLDGRENESFKVKVSPPRMGFAVKENIIPLSMIISDKYNNIIGTICSGIVVRELNDKLSAHFDTRYLNVIEIVNNKSAEDQIKTSSPNLKEFLHTNFFNKSIHYFHKLKNLPFSLEIDIKHNFLIEAISRFFFFSCTIIILFSIMMYICLRYNKKYYETPLYEVQNHLESLNKINDKNNLLNVRKIGKFCPITLSDSINKLINKLYPILLDQTDESIEKNNLQKRMLDLIFIEQHFMNFQKLEIGEEKLFINKLYKQINEEYVSLSLYDFFNVFIDYCCEFYPEVNIKLDIKPKDRKDFLFKQTALIETMFTIVTFILRSSIGKEDESLIIRAEFIDNHAFPTIIIEVNIESYLLSPLGKESGPYYVHTSLLAIFLLAKENKLHFNIIRKENVLSFVLEPLKEEINEISAAF